MPDTLLEMACNLAPQCNFLYGYFQCQLLEDTIDVEIIVRTQKEYTPAEKIKVHNHQYAVHGVPM